MQKYPDPPNMNAMKMSDVDKFIGHDDKTKRGCQIWLPRFELLEYLRISESHFVEPVGSADHVYAVDLHIEYDGGSCGDVAA